ncbi:MAG: response regulator transcription factor [Chitinophagaceae bacterium]|nr:response regulator transcription factor [Chitinophagaceae bacterium]MCW5904001.1 response regulator transcription factor [Chitinophagaceae bacterium]
MTEKKEPITFLIGDDHNIVRQGLQLIIDDNFDDVIIYNASSLQQIIQQTKKNKIDIAILDAQFPDGNCISIISELKQIVPTCKILIFTSFEEDNYALKFIDAGADGFLNKLSNEAEIQQAIIEIHETGKYASALTKKLLAIKEYNPVLLNPFGLLSEREMQIARLYAKGLGNLEIANTLNLRQNTISTFKKRIFEKLNITTIVDLIELMKIHIDL